jgi:hypothetical protein
MRQIFSRLTDKLDLGAMIALSLLLGALSVSRLTYPFDVGHFEACVWTPSMMSAEGRNPYQFALREPFVMAPYGYFYYLLVWKQLSSSRYGARYGGDRRYLYLAIICLFLFGGEMEFWRLWRAETYRRRSEGYYKEIVETLKREVPPQSTVISVPPELAIASGHNYHFGDFLQYEDGRSDELQRVIEGAVASKRYDAIVWIQPDSQMMNGYRLVSMKAPLPWRYYPVYLYLRVNSQVAKQ